VKYIGPRIIRYEKLNYVYKKNLLQIIKKRNSLFRQKKSEVYAPRCPHWQKTFYREEVALGLNSDLTYPHRVPDCLIRSPKSSTPHWLRIPASKAIPAGYARNQRHFDFDTNTVRMFGWGLLLLHWQSDSKLWGIWLGLIKFNGYRNIFVLFKNYCPIID
jgi:hypothetical protein